MKVNEKIRILRRQKNLSQENIAAELDIDYTTYNSYEKDGGKIQIRTLEKIASFYGYKSLEEFFSSEIAKDGNYVYEPQTPYLTNTKRVLKVIIELDGVEEHLKEWFSKLEKLNAAI